MVYGVTGYLGGGKSLTCVYLMLQHLSRGGIVLTNIELHLDSVRAYTGRPDVAMQIKTLDPDIDTDPREWPWGTPRGRPGPRVMIVIDEAAEWFTGGGTSRQTDQWAGWLRHSDKHGQDVYLIVQHPQILHRQGRFICQRWLICSNLSRAKIKGIGLRLPPFLRDIVVVNEYESDDLGRRSAMPNSTFRYGLDPAIFRCYDTAATFGQSALVAPAAAYDSGSVASAPASYFAYAFWASLVSWVLVWWSGSFVKIAGYYGR